MHQNIQRQVQIRSNLLFFSQPFFLTSVLVISSFMFPSAAECRLSIAGDCQGSFYSIQKRLLQSFILIITSIGLKIA